MIKTDLIEAINACLTEDAVAEVYLKIRKKGFRKTRFENDAQNVTRDMFRKEFRDQFIDNDDVMLVNYSAYEGRTKCWIEFDLDVPNDLSFFNELSQANQIEAFSFDEDKLENIESLVIVIGNVNKRIAIYKKMSTINIFTRNTGVFVRKGDNGFVTGDINFLRITPGIDLFYINGHLFVVKLDVLEKVFNITDVVIKAAHREISEIEKLGLIENTKKLYELSQDLRYARKLSRLSTISPVIRNGIPAKSIKRFASKHPTLSKLKYNQKDQIVLDSKVSAQLFIKMLNDDYLNSNLTRLNYESIDKLELK